MALHSWRVAAILGLLVALVITIDAQRAGSARSINWALHNLDLAGSRYSTMDQINRSNVAALTPRWLFQYGIIDGVSNQTTPVVVDGSMYLTDPRGSVYALDAADGHLLWSFDVTNLIGGAQREGYVFRNRGPVYADGVVYIATGFQEPSLLAVRADGTGDVTRTHVLWTMRRGAPLTPSPLIVGDELYVVSDIGIASCVDRKTGRMYWQQRLNGDFSASPILADGRIYFLSEDGVATVIAPGREFRKLAANELNGATLASMAVSEGSIFIRSDRHLYRIGAR